MFIIEVFFSLIIVRLLTQYPETVSPAIVLPTAVRPSYARYIMRRVGPRSRVVSWNATKCYLWTAFCNDDPSLNIWNEQKAIVAPHLCIPGDPPYSFALNTYGQCNPLTFLGVQQVPTVQDVVPGFRQANVPCATASFSTISSSIFGPQLKASPDLLTAGLPSIYNWFLAVVATSNGDFNPNYVTPDNAGGFLITNQRPAFDTVQVISVFVQDTYTYFLSNAINITFVLSTCQLRITGPASFQLCNSLPFLQTIPNAQYQITPTPPGPGTTVGGTTIVWFDPILVSSTNGDTQNYLISAQGGTYQVPTTATTSPTVNEVQVYNFTAKDSASGTNYLLASRLITVILNVGC